MALHRGAQLDEVHRFAGVELHDVADPIGERHGVGGAFGEPFGQRRPEPGRPLHRLVEGIGEAGVVDRHGSCVAVAGRELLPLGGHDAVTLQVAERAVVRHHVEAVVGPLERTAGLVASVRPFADVAAHHRQAVLDRHGPHSLEHGGLRQAGVRVEHRSDDLDLALGVPVDQGHRRRRGLRDLVVGQELVRRRLHLCSPGRQVVRRRLSAVGQVDPPQEAGDDLAQLGEHQVGVLASLGKRVRPHPQQQRLEPLAGPVDAHVGQRRRREDPAGRVERLGTDRLAVDEVGVGLALGESLAEVVLECGRQLGVGHEQLVHVADVASPEVGREDLRVAVVAVAPTESLVVGDVAGGLLEVRHEPTPLEDLGQQVRGLLAGQVHPAELGDAVVAVLEEDPVVELFGALQADRRVDRLVAAGVELAHELVEEEPPQATSPIASSGRTGRP